MSAIVRILKRGLAVPLFGVLLLGLPPALGVGTPAPAAASAFWRGADVSFLLRIEDNGGAFRHGGRVDDLLTILSTHGVNAVRLRLWHTPAGGYSDLPRTLALASRVHAHGMDLLLDFHYSDTWADPGHQDKPAAWAALEFGALADSVHAYTRDVLQALRQQGTPPAVVQLGNEITPGFLWNEGRVGGSFNTPEQWARLAELLNRGLQGMEEAFAPDPRPEVMIHIDRGGDNAGCRWFFDHLVAEGVTFDLIGLSFYPWWHGTLSELETNLADLAARYGKEVVVVETAYPWTLGWFDDTHNIVGLPEHLHDGYPATPAGQQAFLETVLSLVAQVPEGRGRGVFYWAPEWISTPTFGSPWENLALFDEAGNALPGLLALGATTGVGDGGDRGAGPVRPPQGEEGRGR